VTTDTAAKSDRRTWLILAGIILLGALLRGLFLGEIAGTAEFTQPTADAAFHDYWARALVTDDWSPPEDNPNPYIDSVPFVRPPGYPYFLATTYKLTGESYLGARIVQMALGLLNCWLAFLLGRMFLNRTVGLILAAFMAVYWAFIYFEAELHAPVLLIALSLVFHLALGRWLTRPTLWRVMVAGLLLGLMALIRPNLLLFVPVAMGWVWYLARRTAPGGRALIPAAVLVAGVILAVVPATIRNLVVAEDFVLISANGAINFHIGNNDSSDGVTTRIPDLQELTGQTGWSCFSYDQLVQGISEREGRSMKYSEVSRYFWRQGLDYIAGHPGRFLALTARRATLFWGGTEVSNNKAIAFEKTNSKVLRLVPGFPLFLALALLGTALLVMDRRRVTSGGLAPDTNPATGPLAALVGLYIVTTFVSFLPFLVAARFRVPLLPFVFLFGAYGFYRFGQAIAARAWSRTAKLAIAALGFFLLANHSFTDYKADRSWWHTDRAAARVLDGRINEALREFRLALEQNPGYIDAHIGLANLLASLGNYDEAIEHFALVARHRPDRLDVRVGLGGALTLSGKPEQAVRELRLAISRAPATAQARFELGRALAALNRFEEAEKELREAVHLAPGNAHVHVLLGQVIGREGRQDEAIAELRQAVIIDPRSAEAYRGLGALLCAADSVRAGVEAYERALELAPRDATPAAQLGAFFFERGAMEDSAHWFHRAVQIEPNTATYRAYLGSVLANLGRYDEAIREFEAALRIEPRNTKFSQGLQKVRNIKNQAQSGG